MYRVDRDANCSGNRGGPATAKITPGSIQAFETPCFALQLFLVALHRCGGLAFAHRGRLFIELTATNLGEDASFFTGPLEATQSDVERLVFLDSNVGHKTLKLGKKGGGF